MSIHLSNMFEALHITADFLNRFFKNAISTFRFWTSNVFSSLSSKPEAINGPTVSDSDSRKKKKKNKKKESKSVLDPEMTSEPVQLVDLTSVTESESDFVTKKMIPQSSLDEVMSITSDDATEIPIIVDFEVVSKKARRLIKVEQRKEEEEKKKIAAIVAQRDFDLLTIPKLSLANSTTLIWDAPQYCEYRCELDGHKQRPLGARLITEARRDLYVCMQHASIRALNGKKIVARVFPHPDARQCYIAQCTAIPPRVNARASVAPIVTQGETMWWNGVTVYRKRVACQNIQKDGTHDHVCVACGHTYTHKHVNGQVPHEMHPQVLGDCPKCK